MHKPLRHEEIELISVQLHREGYAFYGEIDGNTLLYRPRGPSRLQKYQLDARTGRRAFTGDELPVRPAELTVYYANGYCIVLRWTDGDRARPTWESREPRRHGG